MPFYVAAVPGSFHKRLFPSSSVHFFNSASSLHWFSQGLLKASDVASFNFPHYFPTLEEVKLIIENEGSFDIVQSIIIESSYSNVFGVTQGDTNDNWEKGCTYY